MGVRRWTDEWWMCECCWLKASGKTLGHPHHQQPNIEKLLMRKVQVQAVAPWQKYERTKKNTFGSANEGTLQLQANKEKEGKRGKYDKYAMAIGRHLAVVR
jgi:hypothetical protein